MLLSSRRVACLSFFSLLHIHTVVCRGVGVGIKVDPDSNHGVAFYLAIVFLGITIPQLGYALKCFRNIESPEDDEPTQPHDVGSSFRFLLICYTTIYLLNNILYTVCISKFGDNKFLLPDIFGPGPFVKLQPLQIGAVFTGQFAIFLLYTSLLTVIAYRQRVQLKSSESRLKFKTPLDIWLLATIILLAVSQAGVLKATSSSPDPGIVSGLAIVYETLAFLASLDTAISSFIARVRLSQAGVRDKIINTCAFVVSPIVVAGGIFRIIYIGIANNSGQSFDFGGLLIAAVTIQGVVSVTTISFCLRMGVPTAPDDNDDVDVDIDVGDDDDDDDE